jgi:sugar-specific transcriptional regulator TrmB
MLNPRQLEQFGLNEKEARVYLAALQLGAASVQSIAQTANIHRVSAYDILESLKGKGYVREATEGARRVLIPAEPEAMMESIRQKERVFADLMPELKALQGKKDGKPRVRYFEGRDQVWQVHFDCLGSASAEPRLIYGSIEKGFSSYADELNAKTVKRLAGATARIIAERGSGELFAASKGISRKFVAEGKRFENNIIIAGSQVLSISWDRMMAITIEDQNNADSQRFIFNMLWDCLP